MHYLIINSRFGSKLLAYSIRQILVAGLRESLIWRSQILA